MLADSVVILCDTHVRMNEDQQEHMVDATHIMAVQKLATLFPHLSIVTDIHYRFNIRFMKFAEKNVFNGFNGGIKAMKAFTMVSCFLCSWGIYLGLEQQTYNAGYQEISVRLKKLVLSRDLTVKEILLSVQDNDGIYSLNLEFLGPYSFQRAAEEDEINDN